MKPTTISRALAKAAEDGSARAIEELSLESEEISFSEAYMQHGRDAIKRWIKEGLLQPVDPPIGKRSKMLNRKQLDAVAASSNRVTYLPVRER
ncbi:hypothetical protein [Sphingobacterium hotanense]|uniref:hypothetical protein n=1 Tax=Sphingobacterium hotanense TaxID=649196 RepID=UPI0021A31E3D|nr:hypothetical protein [Sphingobacterium hotanense]MCT1526973.1 hypothetical protein [Sphingobacterium hotanense]